jgi:amidohydrolase
MTEVLLPSIPALPGTDEGVGKLMAAMPVFLRDVRRDLHQHPETGFREYRTIARIRAILEQDGLHVHGPVAGTGCWVDIAGDEPGPAVGYRTDIDALPTHDEKDVPYASRLPGVAHLCGHDVHTTVAVGVALLLNRMRSQMRGSVRVFFQPNEEGTPSGAPAMIKEGVLEGLEATYAVHVDPSIEAGKYGVIAGAGTASADHFDLVVDSGRTAHSARPHEAVDTVWVATMIASSLYSLAGRINDARNPSVITICKFEGGAAHNVIPARVTFGGTLRCTDEADRLLLRKRISDTAQAIAALHGAEAFVDWGAGAPPVINDAVLSEHFVSTVSSGLGRDALFFIPRPSMGAEDFGHYSNYLPSFMARLGVRSGPATSYPLHHALFDIDESVLVPTAEMMASVLLTHLEHRVLAG